MAGNEVAINANPCHVLFPRPPPPYRARSLPARNIDRPHPRNIVCPVGAKHVHDVTPRCDPRGWRGMLITPRIPIPIHLWAEAHRHSVPEPTNRRRVLTQIVVITAALDQFKSYIVKCDLDQGQNAVVYCI